MSEQYKQTVVEQSAEQPFNFERWLDVELPRQYENQYKVLVRAGIMGILPEILEDGILGIDGREYPVPSLEQIKAEILKNRGKYELKMKQGFTRLQLTPFALPLREMIVALEKNILKHYKEGKLLAPKANPIDPEEQLELDTNQPVWNWGGWWDKENNFYKSADELGEIKYYPKEFSEDDHGGKSKQEILDEERAKKDNPFAGWKVLLLEDDLILKGEGQGKTIAGRQQLEANGTPIDYLRKLQDGEQYASEQGLTNEDWLMLFMNSLEENNRVIDDYDGQGKVSYLLASWSPVFGYLGYGLWFRLYKPAYWHRDRPGDHDSNSACRSAVGVGEN